MQELLELVVKGRYFAAQYILALVSNNLEDFIK